MAIKRTVTGLIITAIFATAIFVPAFSWLLPLIFAISAFLGVHEYCSIAKKKENRPIMPIAQIITAALLADAFYFGFSHFTHILILGISLTCIFYVIFYNHLGSISGVATTIFAALWMGLPMSFGILILKENEYGTYITGFLLGVVSIADVGAYIVGSSLGKHKLCPRLSPNKTVEGAIGGLFFSCVSALLIFYILKALKTPIFTLPEILVLGFLFSIIGQFGDLIESGFKRDAGVKDSGTIIHGHGGILDLFDSLIFALPLLYLYLKIS
jgi:phosphatidate cytidylyltransferase